MALPAWAASYAWMYVQSVLFQYLSFSSELDHLPSQMKQAKRRIMLLGLTLESLSKICWDEHLDLLRTNDRASEVLQLTQDIAKSIAELVTYLLTIKETTTNLGVFDKLWASLFVYSRPKWQEEKERLIAGVDNVRAEMEMLTQIVTANNARKTCEISHQLVVLRNEGQQRKSLLENLFRFQPPKRQSDVLPRLKVLRKEAIAYVKEMCTKNDTYCWHRFLDDGSYGRGGNACNSSMVAAVILIGEANNLENILGFFIWYAANASPKSFNVDKKSPYHTYPSGESRRNIIVIASEKEVSLTFRNVDDANNMREVLENYRIRFTGYVTGVWMCKDRLEGKQRKRRRHQTQKSSFRVLEGLGGGKHIAEILDVDDQRVLQLWSCKQGKFGVAKDPVYLHQPSVQSSYEVREESLVFSNAKITRTKNGIGHLRDHYDSDKDDLGGEFRLSFVSPKHAQTVYELLNC